VITGESLRSEVEGAKKALKKARENAKSSVLSLRFSADWDAVARYTRDAATALRRCGAANAPLLLEALQLSAEANERVNSFNQVAMDYEEIGNLYMKGSLGDAKKVAPKAVEAYRSAARFFQLNSQTDRSATVLSSAAKSVFAACGPAGRADCMALLNDACAVFEDADRAVTAEQTFKAMLAFLLKEANDTEGALTLLRRQNKLYARRLDMFANDLHKNYVSEVVLLLSLDRPQAAREALEKYESAASGPALDSAFAASDACTAAGALIEGVAHTQEMLDAVRKRYPLLKNLDNAVARIVYKLTAQGKPAVTGAAAAEEQEPEEEPVADPIAAAEDLLA